MSKGTIRKMDATGDTLVAEWDLTEDSIAETDRVFSELVEQGMLLVRCDDETGNRGEKIRTFDPLAVGILAVPQFVGG